MRLRGDRSRKVRQTNASASGCGKNSERGLRRMKLSGVDLLLVSYRAEEFPTVVTGRDDGK
jgi:hypothetical protein